jgi:uncharacterized protein YbjT (DUF2867 family)
LNLADKPDASARDRPDQALLLAGIRYRLAHRVDVARQRGLGDDPSAPHGLQEVISRHNLFPVLDQKEQQIEHLRSNGDELGASLELAPIGVQAIILERKLHFRAPVGQESKENSIAIQHGCKAFRPARAHFGSGFRSKATDGLKNRGKVMKIVVIGGTGLIGTKLATKLRQNGHEVIQAAPSTGVNTITGEGLDRVLSAAEVVVDVANSPSFEDRAALKFFETSSHNLLAAEATAKVRHHVALSVVGTDRLPECGYFRAKLVQENLIQASKIPYTILRATQFFEFVGGIVDSSADGQIVRLSPALFQPVASDDVAAALADVTLGVPVNGIVELAGPEPFSLDGFARQYLTATKDPRKVVADIHARYFGAELDDRSLTPGQNPRLGAVRFEDWLAGLRQ